MSSVSSVANLVEMDEDKDFVINVIQYLQNKHGIIFFITTTDFDVLYNWWEKRIPLRLVKEAIASVVSRWQEKNKEIYSFSNFRYEVKKNFKAFLQLSVGSEKDNEENEPPGEKSEFAEMELFFSNFPGELSQLKQDFEIIFTKIKNKESVDLNSTYEKLLDLFKEDHELNVKTGIFLKNLSPQLQRPEIEQRYRLNYLKNKFNIPDLV